jgi:hypothetical protein
MNRRWTALFILLFGVAVAFAAAPPAKVETTAACTNPDFSDAIKSALQPQGLRISSDEGALCEIWLAKTLQQGAGSSGTDYTSLTPGSFAGVIVYPGKAGDYRGHAVPAAAYTMRYETMPADGNHMGVAPTQDFFLLVLGSADQDPTTVFEYDALVNLSRKASKTNHPAPLYLMSPTAGSSPAFHDTGDGHWAVEVKTKAKAKAGSTEIDFPLAIVLIGKGEG